MIKLGLIGWRGMVGKVLLNRLKTSYILKNCNIFFFTTNIKLTNIYIHFAYNINLLNNMDIIISCQGSEFTKKIFKILNIKNWKGYWIDASSFLRMNKNSNLILDPINKNYLLNNLSKCKIYSGVNCTVSLCILSIKKLLELNLIDWIFSSSYQAISGAGSKLLNNFLNEINLSFNITNKFNFISKKIKKKYKNPLLYNIYPWIDKKVNFGHTKEEWKSKAEAEKLLNKCLLIDSNCVRVSSLRCHSQNFVIKLKKKLSLSCFYDILNYNNIKLVNNNLKATINYLNPFNVSEKLKIYLGRIRKSLIDDKIYNIFSVGDQLLWGAAEPIKRFLEILLEYLL